LAVLCKDGIAADERIGIRGAFTGVPNDAAPFAGLKARATGTCCSRGVKSS